MQKISKLTPHCFLLALLLATGCSVVGGGVSGDPAVQALEQEVKTQEALTDQAKQEARSAEDRLNAVKSRLDAAKHQAKANKAVN